MSDTSHKLIKTAAASALLAAFIGGAALISSTATAEDGFEKCAGIAKAGMNDCATKAHGCHAQAKVDRDPADWIKLPAGACAKIAGGKVIA
jgi:uncharacterized membrane protein